MVRSTQMCVNNRETKVSCTTRVTKVHTHASIAITETTSSGVFSNEQVVFCSARAMHICLLQAFKQDLLVYAVRWSCGIRISLRIVPRIVLRQRNHASSCARRPPKPPKPPKPRKPRKPPPIQVNAARGAETPTRRSEIIGDPELAY